MPKGETYVVDKIYEFITELVDTNFSQTFEIRVKNVLLNEFDKKQSSSFSIEGNGVQDIDKILEKLIRGGKNEV